MSGSKTRVRRVYAATRDLLDTIRPGTGEEWVGRFRRRFIAPASLFESGAHVLQNMDMPRADALLLSLIPGITRYMQLERFGRAPRLDTFAKAGEYLNALFLGRTFEHFYMLALDPSGRMLACVFLQRGTTDSAPFTRGTCSAEWCARRACHSSSATIIPTIRFCPRAATSTAR